MIQLYLIIFILSILPRFLFIYLFPETGGDYEIYTTVAKNIVNGCGVSLSEPGIEKCIPHFGGNHGPGYPLFISLIWSIFNFSDSMVRYIQAIIYGFSCIWLSYSLFKYNGEKKSILIVGIVTALSPLLIAWPRYVQTETLALASSIWVLAEIFLSISKNKIRIFTIALALIVASWIRLDNILLSIPVAVTIMYIHGIKEGFIRGIAICLILSSTWFAWTARNIHLGVDLFPSMVMQDGSRPPTGYLSWLKTWVTHEYERPGALWTVNRKNYDTVYIPEYAFLNSEEKIKVENLLIELKDFVGKPFPEHIDNNFKELATERIEEDIWQYWFLNSFIRSYRLWTNPYSSFGWPNEMPDKDLSKSERLQIVEGNASVIFSKIINNPYQAISKAFIAIYRLIMMLLFIYYIIYILRSGSRIKISILLIILSYIASRTLFFSIHSANFETRYLLTAMPFIEIFVILAFFNLFKTE